MARSKRPVLPAHPPRPSKGGRTEAVSNKESRWYWYAALFAAGLFIGIFSIAFVGGRTFVSYLTLSKLVAACCVVGLLIPTRLFWQRFRMSRVEVFLFNVMALGPVLAGLVLWSNYFVLDEMREEVHTITSHRLTVDAYAGRSVLYALENNALPDEPALRRVELAEPEDYLEYKDATAIRYRIGTGWLGYEVLYDRTIEY